MHNHVRDGHLGVKLHLAHLLVVEEHDNLCQCVHTMEVHRHCVMVFITVIELVPMTEITHLISLTTSMLYFLFSASF